MAASNDLLGDLLTNPREALDIEVKRWLDLRDDNQRAALAKGIIALANHGGGYLVVGLDRQPDGQYLPATSIPANLHGLSQDAVQDAVQKYIEPAIHCRTEHVADARTGQRHPIVVVPGGQRVPVKAKVGSPDGKLVKDRVYIRRPGPRSEEPQTTAEWDQLFERCIRARRDELLAGIRDLLAGDVPRGAAREPSIPERLEEFMRRAEARWETLVKNLPPDATPRFPHGYYEAGFAIDGAFDVPQPDQFRELLMRVLRNHSGWPPFVIIDRHPYHPRLVDGAIESHIGPEPDGSMKVPAHHDFWRMAPNGFFYTRRGLNEDGRYKNIEPGTVLDVATPPRRLAEVILQAHYVATGLGATDANLVAKFRWHGLANRQLVAIDSSRYMSPVKRIAHQNDYESTMTMAVSAIPSALPEIVMQSLTPMYQLFHFFPLSQRMVEQEIAELMRHNFR